ncbi:cytochrome B [Photobacterium rosenbergii]|uniref:Cytochrome B n=1 Tax=Photobacterium rosenbergii TaxID=294936 RepID=A0A2T3NHI6_9GAMM|nr:cytochrome b [Photobacterium rosenbergii]PSW14497.1 cytochrome B [Photobacterium rosenbergii]
MKSNQPQSTQTILFHWMTGLSFIATFAIGFYLVDLPRSPEKFELLGLHKSFGVAVLVVALLRVIWRLKEGPIQSATKGPAWQEKAATLVHYTLLVSTLLMPISGIIMSVGGGHPVAFFSFELIAGGEKTEWLNILGKNLHFYASRVVMITLALHVAGALKHHFIDKDITLTRMIRIKKEKGTQHSATHH